MAARRTIKVFDDYKKARMLFVQEISELASRTSNIECLEKLDAIDLLGPLLTDVVPSIRHTAVLALSKLANLSDRAAQSIVQKNILPQLLSNIDHQTKYYKKAAMHLLRSVSKHSPDMAEFVVSQCGLQAMILCINDFDPGTKETAALGFGYIARHNKTLAQKVIDAGGVPQLAMCLQEPELCLKQVSAFALGEVAKHSKETAEAVVNAGCVYFLAKAMCNSDSKLKHQTITALSSIAKHTTDLAETVVEAEVFPDVLILMSHPNKLVARSAAVLVREITKHSLELCQMVVHIGGIGALLELISTNTNDTRLPGIMALGFIAGQSDQLALAITECEGVTDLARILNDEQEDHVLGATVWAIGHIGKHSPQHAKYLAEANLFSKMTELYTSQKSSRELKVKCKEALKITLEKCLTVSALEPLLFIAPSEILKYIVGQFSKILPKDPKARRTFVESGGLRKIQEIKAEPGSSLMEYISIINCCFPDDIVRYFSPGYPATLLERVEQYKPEYPCGPGSSETSQRSNTELSELSNHGVEHRSSKPQLYDFQNSSKSNLSVDEHDEINKIALPRKSQNRNKKNEGKRKTGNFDKQNNKTKSFIRSTNQARNSYTLQSNSEPV